MYDEHQSLALRGRLVPTDDAPSKGKSTSLWRGTAGTVVRTSSQFPMQPSGPGSATTFYRAQEMLISISPSCARSATVPPAADRPGSLSGFAPSRQALILHNQRCLAEQRSQFVSADPEHAHRVGRHTPEKAFPTSCVCISAHVWGSIR